MGDVQVWKEGASGEPKFPDNFEVAKKAVLQVTDIKTNRNKYYAVELHTAKNKFRVYTHYGRTDDLDTNPNAGARESRYFDSLPEAQRQYDKIYSEKTSARKGYKEINLASSKIGSKKTMGQSSGTIDDKTLKKLADNDKDTGKKAPVILLHQDIQEIVSYLYQEATNALTSTINATITANGIETPLGVLTIGQIEKGQSVLDQLVEAFEKKKKNHEELTELSGEFYTAIPHRFGRSRAAAELAVLDSAEKLNEKQETLQLMRDMLNVNGKTNVLVNPEIEQKYKALNCEIELVDPGKYKEMKDYFEKSVVRGSSKVKVKNLWKIKRPDEHNHFTKTIDNHKLLFHGSASKNWVGILSRGLLLPKIVVTLGVHRTDAGWLGSGIYFGDAACTSAGYAHPGKRGTRFIAIANVALGKMKDYSKITYGLSEPPAGYHSTHGVRGTQFADNEYVIYKHDQQRLEYLVECTYGYY
jgi:poly [ADP-ribose] polymerase